ncbi:MAG: hypothetical protein KU28_00705 [Sulfurovum sp. PC08-66]|nr:MAG: hypothetical protein KU28_00705 [Sulfurovum sp. PC08-66]KIM12486.1 MAG: hypothetical protein KU37_00820 [Sulfuricurvum sp. PC08-66]
MRQLLLLLLLLGMSGCGYKPSSHYAKKVLGESVYATIEIFAQDPENAVIIKDAVLQALVSRFRVSVTPQNQAQTTLDLKLGTLLFSPIEYDTNGYVIAQRAYVTLTIVRTSKHDNKSYSVQGSYDFSIQPNGLISETQRFNAIREASLRAIDLFITQLAVEGAIRS